MTAGLFELAMVILLAALFGAIARFLRQPLLMAYLGAGLVIGWLNLLNINDQETFHFFSDLGIMFLLFLVGLEINYSSLRLVGKVSVLVGLGQILFTSIIGFGLAWALGFEALPAAYLAIGLTFSSTIVIVKLLSEKKDLNSLYGKISIGFMLVQDFVAILLLVALAGVETSDGLDWVVLGMTVLKGLGLFALMLWLGRKILPFVFDRVARSQELLFVISLAWLFLLTALVSKIGFSIEIAGFLAGLALANSSEHYQIANRIRSLRDFFILVFFVLLGSSLMIGDLGGLWAPILAFSLFVLIGNPIIVLVIMGLMKYRKRTSFLTGLTVAQISEFSLVLAALGLKVGHVGGEVVAILTAVAILTITLSTYMILYANWLYGKLSRLLSVFERKNVGREPQMKEREARPIVLIGAHRTGQSVLLSLPPSDVLVIDFDPEVIAPLRAQGFDCLFGDISDPDIMEEANLDKTSLVISTSPDLQDNLALVEEINLLRARPKIIVRAETEEEARILYGRGVNYVLLPHLTSGQYLGKTLAVDPTGDILESLKQKDLALLGRNNVFHPSESPARS